MKNLDMLAAQYAQKIIARTIEEKQKKTDVENVVTKALGVIQEQGVYAGMLYLLSRSNKHEKPIAGAVKTHLVALLGADALKVFNLSHTKNTDNRENTDDSQDLLKHFADKVCAAPIPTLLLVKNLFEQTLMYARYSAKARPDDKKGSSDNNDQAQEN